MWILKFLVVIATFFISNKIKRIINYKKIYKRIFSNLNKKGELAEWFNAAVLKTAILKGIMGSNPLLSSHFFNKKYPTSLINLYFFD